MRSIIPVKNSARTVSHPGCLLASVMVECYGAVTVKLVPLLRPKTSGAYIW